MLEKQSPGRFSKAREKRPGDEVDRRKERVA